MPGVDANDTAKHATTYQCTLSVESRGDTLLRHQLEGRTLGTSAMVWDLTALMEGLSDGRYVVAFESNLEVD